MVLVETLDVHDLTVIYGHGRRRVRSPSGVTAVNNVSLSVGKKEILALVGESGSGKTTLGRTICRLQRPTSGQIFLGNRDITSLAGRKLRSIRSDLQMVFQDPFSSLNPMMTVGQALDEVLRLHSDAAKSARADRIADLLYRFGLPRETYGRYPTNLSGGQRQRVAIARALIVEPEFVVCDEVVSALDVSTQGQILELLHAIREEMGTSMLFITHDLSIVPIVADRVAVMYQGSIVETGEADVVMHEPSHWYTKSLMSSIPGKSVRRWNAEGP